VRVPLFKFIAPAFRRANATREHTFMRRGYSTQHSIPRR